MAARLLPWPIMAQFHVAILSTGGTIEKTYNQRSGELANSTSVLDHLLGSMWLPDLRITRVELMNKDSLEMTASDHAAIAAAAVDAASGHDGVVVIHGTDRLHVSGEATHALGPPRAPIVFTGAMRPYELRDTDATQNVTEALLAVRLCPPGVYVAMHNKVLAFPGVEKDRASLTFVRART